MFRLDNILEDWAQIYKPLSHDPRSDSKHRTFFRISMIDGNSEFIRKFATTPSPAMGYVTHPDGEIAKNNGKAISYRHVIYFMVKQAAATLSKTQATDDLGATEARFQTDDHVQDLLVYLGLLKEVVNGKSLPSDTPDEVATLIRQTATAENREGIRGLQLDAAHWSTLPLPNGTLSGWHICGLTIEQITPRRLCILPARYRSSSSD